MALAITAGLLLAQVVAFIGIDAALDWAFGSKDEKLQKAALDLQKRQAASGARARSKLADKERAAQRRGQSSQRSTGGLLSLIEAVASRSSVPGDETESETAEQMSLGSVRAGDLTDQHHTMDVGDGDVEGLLAAIASLQEKTRSSDEAGVYGRLLGRRNA